MWLVKDLRGWESCGLSSTRCRQWSLEWFAVRLAPAFLGLLRTQMLNLRLLVGLPAAQAVMCIASGLASSLMAFVSKSYHHYLLCALLMWLGVFFMVLPAASQSIFALTPVFALQVLPRPWIGQMTNLLVSELYDDASLSSAAQSFNQGWEALQNTRQEARKPYVWKHVSHGKSRAGNDGFMFLLCHCAFRALHVK